MVDRLSSVLNGFLIIDQASSPKDYPHRPCSRTIRSRSRGTATDPTNRAVGPFSAWSGMVGNNRSLLKSRSLTVCWIQDTRYWKRGGVDAIDSLFIAGEWAPATGTEVTELTDPSTECPFAQVRSASTADINRAVAAARQTLDNGAWSRCEIEKRIEALSAVCDHLEQHVDEIGSLVTTEMGAPIAYTVPRTRRAIGRARFFLRVARSLPLEEIRHTSTGPVLIVREPVGVVAAIGPFNGPFAVVLMKVIPALVAGCSVVYKPSIETSLDARYFAEAIRRVGLPEGVFNLIAGGADVGRELVTSSGVDKVSFTGSTAVGQWIAEVCGRELRRVQLELGGKSAAIVLKDADLERAITALALGGFDNAGQVCASFSRILVHRSLHDELVDRLVLAARAIKVGDPREDATQMGPLTSSRQRDRVEKYVAIGLEEGAVVATGGRRPPTLPTGWFYEPTVFVRATHEMRIAREEIFGPVVTILPFEDERDAIRMANDSPYGLHGGVFTGDQAQGIEIAKRVVTGTFSINSFSTNAEAPFGGRKRSGIGTRERTRGPGRIFGDQDRPPNARRIAASKRTSVDLKLGLATARSRQLRVDCCYSVYPNVSWMQRLGGQNGANIEEDGVFRCRDDPVFSVEGRTAFVIDPGRV